MGMVGVRYASKAETVAVGVYEEEMKYFKGLKREE